MCRCGVRVLVGSACTPVADGSASGPPERTLTVFAAASLTTSSGRGRPVCGAASRHDRGVRFCGQLRARRAAARRARRRVFASATRSPWTGSSLTSASPTNRWCSRATRCRSRSHRRTLPVSARWTTSPWTGQRLALCAEHVPAAASRAVLDAAGSGSGPGDVGGGCAGRAHPGPVGRSWTPPSCTAPTWSPPQATCTGIDIPEAAAAVNDYPIAVLADAAEPESAQAWTAFVTSPDNAKVLDDAGFLLP